MLVLWRLFPRLRGVHFSGTRSVRLGAFEAGVSYRQAVPQAGFAGDLAEQIVHCLVEVFNAGWPTAFSRTAAREREYCMTGTSPACNTTGVSSKPANCSYNSNIVNPASTTRALVVAMVDWFARGLFVYATAAVQRLAG